MDVTLIHIHKLTDSPGPPEAYSVPCLWVECLMGSSLLSVHSSASEISSSGPKALTTNLEFAFEDFAKGFSTLEVNSMSSVYPSIRHFRWNRASEIRHGKIRLKLKMDPFEDVAGPGSH